MKKGGQLRQRKEGSASLILDQTLVSSFYFCYSHASMLTQTTGKTCNTCNKKPATTKGMCDSCYKHERRRSTAVKEGREHKPKSTSNIGKFVLFFYFYAFMLM